MLAHTLPVGMGEGGLVLPLSLAPLTTTTPLPSWSADPHVVAFCQSVATGVGVIGSAGLLRRLLLLDLADRAADVLVNPARYVEAVRKGGSP